MLKLFFHLQNTERFLADRICNWFFFSSAGWRHRDSSSHRVQGPKERLSAFDHSYSWCLFGYICMLGRRKAWQTLCHFRSFLFSFLSFFLFILSFLGFLLSLLSWLPKATGSWQPKRKRSSGMQDISSASQTCLLLESPSPSFVTKLSLYFYVLFYETYWTLFRQWAQEYSIYKFKNQGRITLVGG